MRLERVEEAAGATSFELVDEAAGGSVFTGHGRNEDDERSWCRSRQPLALQLSLALLQDGDKAAVPACDGRAACVAPSMQHAAGLAWHEESVRVVNDDGEDVEQGALSAAERHGRRPDALTAENPGLSASSPVWDDSRPPAA